MVIVVWFWERHFALTPVCSKAINVGTKEFGQKILVILMEEWVGYSGGSVGSVELSISSLKALEIMLPKT